MYVWCAFVANLSLSQCCTVIPPPYCHPALFPLPPSLFIPSLSHSCPVSVTLRDFSCPAPVICFLFTFLIIPLFQPVYIPVSLTSSLSLSVSLRSLTYLQHSCLMNNGGETVTISVSITGSRFWSLLLSTSLLPFLLSSHLLSRFSSSYIDSSRTKNWSRKPLVIQYSWIEPFVVNHLASSITYLHKNIWFTITTGGNVKYTEWL